VAKAVCTLRSMEAIGPAANPDGKPRIAVGLGILVAVLAAVASAAGVFLRGDLTTEPFTTVRGETIEVVTDGVYRYNSEGVVAEGLGWDLVTLLVIVPVTLLALALLWRGSFRAVLVGAGLLAYFAYQYFQYAVFWAYGPLYPLHVLTFALAISALAILVVGVDLAGLRARVTARFPHRTVVGYALIVVFLLLGLWLPVIARTLGGEVTDELEGATTLVVPAFDLGLLVPLGLFTAIAVARRLAVGYLLGMVILVKGASMALAISAMLLVEWQVTDELALPPLIVFASMAVLSAVIGLRALGGIGERGIMEHEGRGARH
jgi:hypothetical protein